MKITGNSSSVTINFGNRTVTISGEFMVGGFIAYSDSIHSWDSPFNHEIIDNATKQKIIDDVVKKTANNDFKIVFE